MLALVQFNLVTLAIALLIGVLTARWMFARRPTPQPGPEDSNPS
jgi:hypothetical protein